MYMDEKNMHFEDHRHMYLVVAARIVLVTA